jgi:hypothetical protein
MMETMEVLGVDPQDEVEAENGTKPIVPEAGTPSTSEPAAASTSNIPNRTPTPNTSSQKTAYPAITAGPHPPSAPSSTVAAGDKGRKKRKGLTPEQKEKLQQIQQEQEVIRQERVANLSQKLLQKISVWIETDRNAVVTEAFKKKMEVSIFRECHV